MHHRLGLKKMSRVTQESEQEESAVVIGITIENVQTEDLTKTSIRAGSRKSLDQTSSGKCCHEGTEVAITHCNVDNSFALTFGKSGASSEDCES